MLKFGVSYHNLLTIHPIYVIWDPSSLMKTPDRNTKFREIVPKMHIYTYISCQCEPTPPPLKVTIGLVVLEIIPSVLKKHFQILSFLPAKIIIKT